ncbi:hypothetical protein K438DRAFT_2123976 [Mycena galopus ATCC 62051]|nr:hypothetical protein K438DRAFT_2123976 [Mycena galopus ATCC 62051]
MIQCGGGCTALYGIACPRYDVSAWRSTWTGNSRARERHQKRGEATLTGKCRRQETEKAQDVCALNTIGSAVPNEGIEGPDVAGVGSDVDVHGPEKDLCLSPGLREPKMRTPYRRVGWDRLTAKGPGMGGKKTPDFQIWKPHLPSGLLGLQEQEMRTSRGPGHRAAQMGTVTPARARSRRIALFPPQAPTTEYSVISEEQSPCAMLPTSAPGSLNVNVYRERKGLRPRFGRRRDMRVGLMRLRLRLRLVLVFVHSASISAPPLRVPAGQPASSGCDGARAPVDDAHGGHLNGIAPPNRSNLSSAPRRRTRPQYQASHGSYLVVAHRGYMRSSGGIRTRATRRRGIHREVILATDRTSVLCTFGFAFRMGRVGWPVDATPRTCLKVRGCVKVGTGRSLADTHALVNEIQTKWQVHTYRGQPHGKHSFVVKIRRPNSLTHWPLAITQAIPHERTSTCDWPSLNVDRHRETKTSARAAAGGLGDETIVDSACICVHAG